MHPVRSHALAAAALASACVWTMSPAAAVEPGAFVTAGVAHARNDVGLFQADTTTWRVGAGYRWAITPTIAVGFEVGYADLGTVLQYFGTFATPTGPSLIPIRFGAKGPTIGIDARFDLAPAWYVGARVGAQRANYSLRPRPFMMPAADETGWYAGARIGHDIGPAWSLALAYDRVHVGFGAGDIDSDQWGVQAEYRF